MVIGSKEFFDEIFSQSEAIKVCGGGQQQRFGRKGFCVSFSIRLLFKMMREENINWEHYVNINGTIFQSIQKKEKGWRYQRWICIKSPPRTTHPFFFIFKQFVVVLAMFR